MNILKKINRFYTTQIAPLLSKHLYWYLIPLYRLCRSQDLCFVVNISSGIGHTAAELDYFFRTVQLNKPLSNKKYILLRPGDICSKTFVSLYRHYFFFAASSYILYSFFLPLSMRFTDITIDVGLSRLKYQLKEDLTYEKPLPGHSYLYQISKQANLSQWNNYYITRAQTMGWNPLTQFNYPKVHSLDRWELKGKKIALIHIKEIAMNATPLPTDPQSYIKTLDFLQDLGYQPIFIGRERFPKIFHNRSIINYAQSSDASIINDILLFQKATLSLIAGSGLSFLADSYNKPYLYINSWHLSMPMFSKKCVSIPALVSDRSRQLLNFEKQDSLYRNRIDHGEERFPYQDFNPVNASSEEILKGMQELLRLEKEFKSMSALQRQFNAQNKSIPLYYAQSRCSEHFLNNHQQLF